MKKRRAGRRVGGVNETETISLHTWPRVIAFKNTRGARVYAGDFGLNLIWIKKKSIPSFGSKNGIVVTVQTPKNLHCYLQATMKRKKKKKLHRPNDDSTIPEEETTMYFSYRDQIGGR